MAQSNPSDSLHFFHGAYRNHAILISITLPTSKVGSPEHVALERDVCQMMESVSERKPDSQQFSDLQISDQQKIDKAAELLDSEMQNAGLSIDEPQSLQVLLEPHRLNVDDHVRIESIGLKFGELFRAQVPSFAWRVLHDDDGKTLCLKLGNTSITIFPTAMIAKRVYRHEEFLVADLFDGLVDTIEEMFKKGY